MGGCRVQIQGCGEVYTVGEGGRVGSRDVGYG